MDTNVLLALLCGIVMGSSVTLVALRYAFQAAKKRTSR